MEGSRAAVYAVTALIVLVTLVSGPLVGAVDLTRERSCSAPVGSGSATVAVESLPDRATIAKGQFDSGAYYLSVPDGVATVTNVTGQPLLSYDISVPEIGFTSGPTLFLCDGQAARQPLSIGKLTFEASELDSGTYNATLSVRLRGEEETVVRTKQIVVQVKR